MLILHLLEIPPQGSHEGSLFISVYSLYKVTGSVMMFSLVFYLLTLIFTNSHRSSTLNLNIPLNICFGHQFLGLGSLLLFSEVTKDPKLYLIKYLIC